MLLSIIIPAYNVERFIARTLEMLISQNLDDCEVIVVNDGSKDKTFAIAQEVAEKDSRIKVFTQKNKGVSVARNVGIQNASGKYVYFMDSDDTLTDGTLDFWRNLLHEKPDLKMYGFGYKSVAGGKEKKYVYKDFDKQTIENPLLKQIFLTKKICFHICSCIYENSFLCDNNLQFTPGLKIGEDVEFILKALDKTDSLYYDARECFVYLIRDDSAMQGYKSYSLNQFNSFIVIKNNVEQMDVKMIYGNYFIIFSYISNLYHFLKVKKDKRIQIIFKKYKYVLYREFDKSVSGKINFVIFILRILPLRLLFLFSK